MDGVFYQVWGEGRCLSQKALPHQSLNLGLEPPKDPRYLLTAHPVGGGCSSRLLSGHLFILLSAAHFSHCQRDLRPPFVNTYPQVTGPRDRPDGWVTPSLSSETPQPPQICTWQQVGLNHLRVVGHQPSRALSSQVGNGDSAGRVSASSGGARGSRKGAGEGLVRAGSRIHS